ncbi:glycoside hydrolase family 3 protein [Hoeflea alexandrii]|uniref:beta-N-acetylhexosaminidase n=1 Tax=Hoeflea alexandrii TaxID=288436 RepID=A0ABT1CLW7_9HYPH|nr:glycoside hydrolase family 3 N-terminal domain-containing protein [Hoeflea alexandrii]MCO6407202.1 glycoside hydrolase family 3 protein [Hoeflea alexandrii]
MRIEDLAKPPFNLDAPAISWVRQTLGRLSPDDRLRQLFNLLSVGDDPEAIARVQAFRPGGITRMRGGDIAHERAVIDDFNVKAQVPLLVSADLEGSRMSLAGGAEWPNPLALAAIDDLEVTETVSRMMAEEARAAGINWSFTPVLDINAAWRSPIVATRGFGSDPEVIARHALTQMRVFQRHGIASAVKHWPGEGHDDRDQHLVTTINPLSMDEWEASFGRLYRGAIEAGVMSVMSAHIALPAFVREQAGDGAGVEAFRPASISRILNDDLLRRRLGFNGLIVSDATAMAGLGAWSKRSEHLPEIIASGCDVILFSNDPEQDLRFLEAALADGRLTWERVDEAVMRQLGLKAALGLHAAAEPPRRTEPEAAKAYAAEVARRAPTLVKDVRDLLPLDPDSHKRVLVISGGIVFPFLPEPLPFALPDMFADKGFEITMHEPGMDVRAEKFDLILYLFGDETLLTRGRIFLDWLGLTGHFGAAMARHWHEIPTVMISFGYPYLLYDAPRVPTYINAYSTTETMQRAVADLLTGEGEWNSNNPVDPFCGLEDARY